VISSQIESPADTLAELRSALAELESGDPLTRLPSVLGQVVIALDRLATDGDEQLARVAAAGRDRLRSRRPALRFELLGGFRVKRAGVELDDGAWQRPMAARVVRFLLMQGGACVPEDALFEAFWPERTADSARQHLAQAVSRARKVLDLPDAEESVIEVRERTYRLRLREMDSVDTSEFEAAAAEALADHGSGRRAALETAVGLWSGEPLPEDRYAAWPFIWRERLVEKYAQVLSALVDSYDDVGEHHDVVRVAGRLLELEPLDEHAHRCLIAAYARTGRTSLALQQFLACRKALIEELGIEPAAATSDLQARILAGEPV
jgi:DNA-binding SARP family transcriptional activator